MILAGRWSGKEDNVGLLQGIVDVRYLNPACTHDINMKTGAHAENERYVWWVVQRDSGEGKEFQ